MFRVRVFAHEKFKKGLPLDLFEACAAMCYSCETALSDVGEECLEFRCPLFQHTMKHPKRIRRGLKV